MAEVSIPHSFMCIGAQKAGTTTLADILSEHPSIFIPRVKETKFFLFDEDYEKGLDFYNNTYFSEYNGQQVAGEFDPDYILYPETAKRISTLLGSNMKFIVVLRDPAQRAYSHYLMSRKKGIEELEFEAALEAEASRDHSVRSFKTIAYVQRGKYGSQLAVFLNEFPKENFLFLQFETDIVQNLQNTLEKIQEFIGVPMSELDATKRSNEAAEAINPYIRDMVRRPNFAKRMLKAIIPSGEFRKRVRRTLISRNQKASSAGKLDEEMVRRINDTYFKDEIEEVRRLTGLHLEGWLV